MKTKRQAIQTLILVAGLVGSIVAFVSTPRTILGEGEYLCGSSDGRDCIPDVGAAALRGGSVLVLAAFAFAGVTIIFKD